MVRSIANQIITITEDYIGPPAERFIERLSRFHLNKTSEELTPSDVPRLTEWIKVSLGLLTNDRNVIDECVTRLLKLAP